MSEEEFIEKLKKECDWAELFYQQKKSLSIEFDYDKLKSLENKESSGVALRLVKDGKIGFSNSAILDQRIIEYALSVAKFGNKCFYIPPDSPNIKEDIIDSKIEEIDTDAMIEQGNKIIKKIKKYNPEVTVSVGFGKGWEHVKICNTKGLNSEFRKNYFSMGFRGTVFEEGNILDWWKGTEKLLTEKEYDQIIEEFIEEFKIMRNNVSINTGKLPMILAPESLPWILKALEEGVHGENVYKKVSPLTEKLNDQVMNEKFSLIDDGTLDQASGTYPFDDEGVKTSKKYIFNKGILLNYLHNLETSYLLKQNPTGNGFRTRFLSGRDYMIKPGIEITNWIIEPGDMSLDEMLSDIKEGILLKFSPDCWQSNIINGEVQGSIVVGLKIENGKLVGRVKDLSFSCNIYDLFNKQLVGLGDTLYTPGTSDSNYRLPYIYVKDISVS